MTSQMLKDVMRMADLVLFGMEVVESEFIVDRVQVRFPRSKKKRVRKKWAKQARNCESRPSVAVYRLHNVLTGSDYLMGHPVTIGKMRDAIRRENDKHAEKWR